MNLFKKNIELEILSKEFCFLESDFCYKLKTAETKDFYKGFNLIVYRNDQAEKQIEICGGVSFFHCIIRQIINGKMNEYKDESKNIGFEDLALIDNPEYDHFDFYAGAAIGVKGVTKNTIKLFKRQKIYLTNKEWFNLREIDRLKNEKFKSQFGFDMPKRKVFFKDEIKQMISENHENFELVFDNRDFPFFHNSSTLEKLIYKNDSDEIIIRQVDWRDFPSIYNVLKNGKLILEVDISEINQEKALEKIKNCL